MSDRQIKNALLVSILLGLVLGAIWGICRYADGLADPRSWNLMGLGLIVTVAGYAGLHALKVTLTRKA